MAELICYIPTKSRFTTNTYKLFEQANIPVLHFIEPDELALYPDYLNKIDIQANNQGIVYVRNFMLQYAKSHKHEWVIICDDDVTKFGGVKQGKTVAHADASLWWNVLKKAQQYSFELIGLNYCQYAWAENKFYSINRSFVEVCVLFHIPSISWHYRLELQLKEDRDFSLQAIKYGHGILKFHKYWHSCPAIGSNKGGLSLQYQNKADWIASKKMAKTWSNFVQAVYVKGRLDIKVNLAEVAQYYNKVIK